jgi:Zn-dependent peptidase ImmA (M78 family)
MKLSIRRKIETEVNRLLRETGTAGAPIDVEKIANVLGIAIRRTPTNDEISGFLLRNPDGQAVIGVNTLHHPNRQRFTIAHELGHFILHKQEEVHVDRAVIKLRDGASSKGEDPDEVEANGFAAELLMPTGFLSGDLERFTLTDLLDDRRMQQLAKRYQVSVQAMTNRLVSRGVLPNTSK